MTQPDIYTGELGGEAVREMAAAGELIAVRLSYRHPDELGVSLGYELEEVSDLLPEEWMFANWEALSRHYRKRLDSMGVARIGAELRALSERHGGLPLVLVDFDDAEKGLASHRHAFARFIEETTGETVYEIATDGRYLHWSALRFKVPVPAAEGEDYRYAHAEFVPESAPMSGAEFGAWAQSRHWQTSKGPNVHQYTHRDWSKPQSFEQALLTVRSHGYPQRFGKATYTVLDCGEYFYFAGHEPLAATIILNRKRLDGATVGSGGLSCEYRPSRYQRALAALRDLREGQTLLTPAGVRIERLQESYRYSNGRRAEDLSEERAAKRLANRKASEIEGVRVVEQDSEPGLFDADSEQP